MPVPEFVLDLRAHLGRDYLLWLPGVTAVVLRDEHVLLVQRSDNGAWGPVTGIVDPGEHPATTATREVLEETGVRCEVDDLVWVSVGEPVMHANGDRAQYLDHTFRCRYLDGTPHAADDESLDARWFPLDAMPTMSAHVSERIETAIHPGSRTRLT